MQDLELLEAYEPTLRFAKSERFFPMAVEPYLEYCTLHPSGPDGVMERVLHPREFDGNLVSLLGHIKSEQFFLRFVNKRFDYESAWRWLLAAFLIGFAAGGFFFGATGIAADLLISFLAALFLFMLASPIRLRIISSSLAAVLFCAASFAPAWFFLHPSRAVDVSVEYFILLSLYVIFLVFILIRILKFVIDRVIPEGPGLVMDMLSRATEKVAKQAYAQYAEILQKHPQPVYYGRALREKDEAGNAWTILQYHFFYAFNDWRLAANGMNHHEGDWELVAIYLKNDLPYAVLFSQHGSGCMELWENAPKVKDESGADTTHPIVYVALGSHANYSRAGVIRSPDMYKPGRFQRFLLRLDGVIHFLFLWLNPEQRKVAIDALHEQKSHVFDEGALDNIRYGDDYDDYVVRLPMEIATGDGFRIGPHEERVKEKAEPSSKFLKRVMSRRDTVRPSSSNWRRILLNSNCDWVQYKGLWGVKSWLKEESGPSGPRWERPRTHESARERIRWGQPLKWLELLEKNAHSS